MALSGSSEKSWVAVSRRTGIHPRVLAASRAVKPPTLSSSLSEGKVNLQTEEITTAGDCDIGHVDTRGAASGLSAFLKRVSQCHLCGPRSPGQLFLQLEFLDS